MPLFSLITRQRRDLSSEGAGAKVGSATDGRQIPFAELVGDAAYVNEGSIHAMRREEANSRLALAAALALGVGLLVVAPFLGLLRDLLIARLPRAFAPLLLAGFGLAAGAALLLAALRIRERRRERYLALLLAVALAAGLLGLFRTGLAEVDAVERIHVLAYGLLACLFARALAPRRDPSTWLLAFLAAALVGILDEWVQWLVPTRVGDVRDVGLNAGAALPGLLIAWASAPGAAERRMAPGSRRLVALAAAAGLLALAGFYDAAHLGHRLESPGLGSFRSWHAPGELATAAAQRAERWREQPPGRLAPLSREDYFLTEGTWRVTARNAALAHGDLTAAWLENLLLEAHYGPVLDLLATRSGEPHRWPAWKRAEIEAARPRPDPLPYASPVLAPRIHVWVGREAFWVGVLMLAAALAFLALSRAGTAAEAG